MENHCRLAEVYVTHPNEATAHRLLNRKGYRKTLQEKVELAVARLINGSAKADNRDALANPEALDGIGECLAEAGLLPKA